MPPEEYELLLNHLQHDLAARMPGFDHGMGFLDILKRENSRDMRLELTIRHHLRGRCQHFSDRRSRTDHALAHAVRLRDFL